MNERKFHICISGQLIKAEQIVDKYNTSFPWGICIVYSLRIGLNELAIHKIERERDTYLQ